MWIRFIVSVVFLVLLFPGTLSLGQEEEVPEKPHNLRVFTRYDGAIAVASGNYSQDTLEGYKPDLAVKSLDPINPVVDFFTG